MRDDPARADGGFDVGIVVTLIEAHVLGAARSAWSSHGNRVQYFRCHPLVVNVGAGHARSKRYAAPVRQNVALGAAFRAIRRVRTRVGPPFGAFTEALSSDVHFQSMPRRSS